ncbi:MAG: ABC transporter permease [Solirubrobacteraceae bacterium]
MSTSSVTVPPRRGERRGLQTAVAHSCFFAQRELRNLARQPWWIAVSLAQPIIYLLLFAALFRKIVEIPGFGARSYVNFFTPGVVVMTALFSGGWGGMGIINDLDRGVMDRFLVSPAYRGALIAGRLAQQTIVSIIQSLIIVGLALAIGASFPGGVLGVLVLLCVAILLGMGFGALSISLGLLLRREESVIAAVQFVLLPLTFLSSVFMAQNLAPAWIQDVGRFNPVNWAAQAGRAVLGANVDWGLVGSRAGYLVAFTLVCAFLATRAFRAYQRSV